MSRVPVSVGLSKSKLPVVLNGALPAIKLGVSNVQPGLKGAAPFVFDIAIVTTWVTTVADGVPCTVIS